jgi:FAD/FMN-containing dehydrogenase
LHNYLLGHIGALTFHPTFILPNEWPVEKRVKAANEITLKEAELNLKYGTCGGEWGTFSKRNSFYLKRYGEKNYQLVKEVKKVFDPGNILNPGVLLED